MPTESTPDEQTLACFGLKKIPLGESARNLRRSRLNFVRTSGEPGINIGAVLREDPMHMKDEDTPALECVVWKITIRVNIAEYCVFSKQQNASRCKKQCWRSKTKAEVALDAAKVVEAFLKDVESKRSDLNPLRLGEPGLTLDDLFLLALEPVGKRMFDCVLAYYPRTRAGFAPQSDIATPDTSSSVLGDTVRSAFLELPIGMRVSSEAVDSEASRSATTALAGALRPPTPLSATLQHWPGAIPEGSGSVVGSSLPVYDSDIYNRGAALYDPNTTWKIEWGLSGAW